MIYVMSPYSGTREDMYKRHDAVAEACSFLFKEDIITFSPIMQWHLSAFRHNLPKDWETWWQYNEVMMNHSKAGLVLQIDGWRQSAGVRKELEWYERSGKPVFFMQPDLPLSKYKDLVESLQEVQSS